MAPKGNHSAKRSSKRKASSTRASKSAATAAKAKAAATAATAARGGEGGDMATPTSDGPIFFWQPREAATGYLSQWYYQPFRDRHSVVDDDGVREAKVYATAEHYMMHHKALLFGDADAAAAVLEVSSPRDAKALGRAVRGFDDAVWHRERERIVVEGSWCKFTLPVVGGDDGDGDGDADVVVVAGEGKKEEKEKVMADVLRTWKLGSGDDAQTVRAPSFRDVLLATGTRELVEASPRDRIWGIGFGAKGAESKRHKWGMNLLGKCLMEVREQFRKEAAEAAAAAAETGVSGGSGTQAI